MGMIKSISGMLTLELTSADIAKSIQNISNMGIDLFELRYQSDLTAVFEIHRTDYRRIDAYARKKGITLKLKRRMGVYWKIKNLVKRPVMIFGLLAIFLMCAFLPTRILFVEVQGNASIPTRLILEAAGESGIRFGASRREVRSEKMKNALLSRVPELQWAGVNTYGSRAVITVRERSMEEAAPREKGVSSIVASRDGLLLSCTVTRGNGLVKVGQAVVEGETLISGYTDCGISIEATRAEGEIFALTSRDLTVKMPAERLQRVSKTQSDEKFSLFIGKKRINFYKGSGISDATCVKMYKKYVLTLPGGFELPLVLLREQTTVCEMQTAETQNAAEQLSEAAEKYLRSIMVAGTVRSRVEQIEQGEAFVLTGRYLCEEMIGRERSEEIGVYHGKTD